MTAEDVDPLLVAARYIERVDSRRAIHRLRAEGFDAPEIARRLDLAETRVQRFLRAAHLFDPDVVTPQEAIYRAAVDGTDRRALIDWLSTYPHVPTVYAPDGMDGSIPGTWTQVALAKSLGLLTPAEYDEIASRVQPSVLG